MIRLLFMSMLFWASSALAVWTGSVEEVVENECALMELEIKQYRKGLERFRKTSKKLTDKHRSLIEVGDSEEIVPLTYQIREMLGEQRMKNQEARQLMIQWKQLCR